MQPHGRRSIRSRVVVCAAHRHAYRYGVRLVPDDAEGRECAVCGATP